MNDTTTTYPGANSTPTIAWSLSATPDTSDYLKVDSTAPYVTPSLYTYPAPCNCKDKPKQKMDITVYFSTEENDASAVLGRILDAATKIGVKVTGVSLSSYEN